MNHEIKSVWGYARTARQRVTSSKERARLPPNCYLCQRRFVHRPDRKVPHEWHHKNGNPFDNRKRNFVALCSRCHSEVHGFAIQSYLFVSWRRLGMRLGYERMAYVTKSGRFFVKRPTASLRRKRSRRFVRLAEALGRWARELAHASNLTKTKRVRYEDGLLRRNLREAIRVAVPTEKGIMQHILKNLRSRLCPL